MPLVTTKQMLLDAQAGNYAVGAFNVENMEMVQAVLAAAEELNSPVIMQTTPSTVKYAGLDYYLANVEAAAKRTKVPVVMHLDHGSSFELAMQAYRTGYTSIMIDGSHESFEDNIAVSKAVADACHPGKVPVEAELGKVGGKEDDLDGGDDNPYTDPQEAKEFVERTGVDSLAVGIGTAHGVYKGEPKLQFDILSQIREVVDIPLVVHGTSGVPDEAVEECIKRGICKVNYATDLRIAFTNGLNKYLAENPDTIDPKKGEVLIKVKYTGICGSDVPRVNGDACHFFPNVLGHEFSGVIEEVGEGVTTLAKGDRIAGVPLVPCMECEDCQKGNYSLCKHYSFIGSRQFGSFAEYVVVPEKNAVKFEDKVSFEQGALFEPATVALHGLNRLNYQAGECVAILGGGTIGLFTAQWAKIFGAKKVVVFDISPERLELAKKLGADEGINTLDEDFMDQAMALTGSWMSYSAPFPGKEWILTAHYFKTGQLKFDDSLIFKKIPLSKIDEAFEMYKTPGTVKGKILIDSEA